MSGQSRAEFVKLEITRNYERRQVSSIVLQKGRVMNRTLLVRCMEEMRIIIISPKLMLILTFAILVSACSSPGPKYVVGAGHKSGYYHPAADSICKILNKSQNQFKCLTKTTSGGSAPNIKGIISGELQFGIAQSDIVYEAWNGSGKWKKIGPQRNLRAVFSMYGEMVTLIAADDAKIATIRDLSGKKVNIGKLGSGHRIMAVHAMDAAGLNWKKDLVLIEEKASQGPKLLQDGSVDAFFYVLAHPSSRIKKAVSGKRKAHFVPIDHVASVVEKYPYYSKTSIPLSWYPNITNSEDIPSFGVKALLITNQDVPENIVFSFAKETFENIKVIQKNHPACRFIKKHELIEALSIPVHAGALKYFKKNALIGE